MGEPGAVCLNGHPLPETPPSPALPGALTKGRGHTKEALDHSAGPTRPFAERGLAHVGSPPGSTPTLCGCVDIAPSGGLRLRVRPGRRPERPCPAAGSQSHDSDQVSGYVDDPPASLPESPFSHGWRQLAPTRSPQAGGLPTFPSTKVTYRWSCHKGDLPQAAGALITYQQTD